MAVLDGRAVTGQVRPCVLVSVDERVDGVAVGRDRGELDPAEVVFDPVGLLDAASAALDRLAVRLAGAWNAERDVFRSVAVAGGELPDLAVGLQAGRQDEPDLALLEHVGGA